MSLSPQRLYAFIYGSLASTGEAPLIREIQERFQIRSPATVHELLLTLERQGKIERTRKWRGIKLIRREVNHGR